MRIASKLIFLMAALIIIGGIALTVSGYSNKQTIKTKVTGKERVTEGGKNGEVKSFYLIFTEAGTLKLEDDLFYGNFNSSDWYGSIHQDSVYTFHVVGYRIGFLSSYQNIVGFEK